MSFKDVFNRVVQNLERDFPEEMARITIINSAAPDGRQQIEKWYSALPKQHQQVLETQSRDIGGVPGLISQLMQETAVAQNTDETGPQLCIVNFDRVFGFEDKSIAMAYYLLHEVGHLIVEHGSESRHSDDPLGDLQINNAAEIVADVFATTYGRHIELLDGEDVAHLSGLRALSAFNGDLLHYTSAGIDAVHVNKNDADFISLSPSEIKAIAAAHSQKSRASKEELQHAYERLNIFSGIGSHGQTPQESDKVLQLCAEAMIDFSIGLPKGHYTRVIAEKVIEQFDVFGKIEPDTPVAKKAAQFLKGPG